jgi:hypothetical protein
MQTMNRTDYIFLMCICSSEGNIHNTYTVTWPVIQIPKIQIHECPEMGTYRSQTNIPMFI